MGTTGPTATVDEQNKKIARTCDSSSYTQSVLVCISLYAKTMGNDTNFRGKIKKKS